MNGQLAEILRDPADIPVLLLVAGVGVAIAVVWAVGWLLPKVADAVPARFRTRVLTLVPALRLAVGLTLIAWALPKVVAPTPQNLLAIVGGLGIALGFAFKDYVASLVAGVVAIAERPYRQGDWVRVGAHYGEVRSVGSRAVQIVTHDDDVVTIPHGRLWTDEVANANDGARTLLVVAELWLHPDHDAEAVLRRLNDVVITSRYLDPTRPFRVVLDEQSRGSRYRLKAYPLDARDQIPFGTDLLVRAKAVVRALGVRFLEYPDAREGRPDGGMPGSPPPAR
jgi:small-conductance mechanosensitive channel